MKHNPSVLQLTLLVLVALVVCIYVDFKLSTIDYYTNHD
jgi:hypothetical protein